MNKCAQLFHPSTPPSRLTPPRYTPNGALSHCRPQRATHIHLRLCTCLPMSLSSPRQVPTRSSASSLQTFIRASRCQRCIPSHAHRVRCQRCGQRYSSLCSTRSYTQTHRINRRGGYTQRDHPLVSVGFHRCYMCGTALPCTPSRSIVCMPCARLYCTPSTTSACQLHCVTPHRVTASSLVWSGRKLRAGVSLSVRTRERVYLVRTSLSVRCTGDLTC
jgi:hypothetical protein